MNQSGRNFLINIKRSWLAKVMYIKNPRQRHSIAITESFRSRCTWCLFVFVFKGTQITQVPVVMRQPLDLFKFFTVVRERGGLQEVSSKKNSY